MKLALGRSALALIIVSMLVAGCAGEQSGGAQRDGIAADRPEPATRAVQAAVGRRGRVRVVGHALVDDGGPFLGLGVSYFSALWRCRNERARLEEDLGFLSRQGFNYYRMLSMVGYYPVWEGREIAPASFTSRRGRRVDAWGDYWQRLRELIDLAYDRFGLRTQITIFADAQSMPDKAARIEHMRRLLAEVVWGRENKIIMLEVANEAWQNGFPGEQGVADLREFATYLNERTEVAVAITSNHDWPDLGDLRAFDRVYAGASADLATWHFSRDRRIDDGWKPVYDCWELGERAGLPPVSSNEPIGPGSSVNSEAEPIRLVMAAAFAYAARLPMYVFHSEAGVMGKTRFEDTPGIGCFGPMMRLLPGDLPNWRRHDAKDAHAPLVVFAGGQANRYWPQVQDAPDGCVRNIGGSSGERFVCVPIGIRAGGLMVEARRAMEFTAYEPLTGQVWQEGRMRRGERVRLRGGSGGLIVVGRLHERSEN